MLVRGFFDANGDGTGDLRGLTEKLDYLEWLGVDCLWLLPFYQSPLRDGGYDISDFFTVLPGYGDVDDAATLVEEAHRRGIRVIADMVMNHTSDAHPWFQESRQDRTNPKADWYVWNDDDQRWPDARIIFVDTEPSNWTWDAQREQYYWHRFFHHQPDLNYDNPEVAEAMLDVVRFWLATSASTASASTPCPTCSSATAPTARTCPRPTSTCGGSARRSTHEFPGKVLLAEANQWPADVVDYFGDGDECHMCFHFPLMPRMFMGVRREQRYPITEILAQTPEIPDGCQWGIFLRNHDELTLEMVTDEERDYMYAEYAKDPRMKRNVGISRRLVPLLDNDRRVAELFHAMLFSPARQPGHVLRRRDRDGRQHLPRRPRRRAHADAVDARPQRRVLQGRLRPALPAAADGPGVRLPGRQRRGRAARPELVPALDHAHARGPQAAPGVRPSAPSRCSRSRTRRCSPTSAAVWTSTRTGRRTSCCASTTSAGSPSPPSSSSASCAGKQPIELMGRVPFPPIGELPYFVTLPGHGFYWFSLVDGPEP